MTDWNPSDLLPTHLRAGRWEEHGDCCRTCPCWERGFEEGARTERERGDAGASLSLFDRLFIVSALLVAGVLVALSSARP